ncbi:blast:Histone acetyltransferase p300 [Drosophila guanche]|uniref:histone acetyltransferase n=1 Tax=Drosophila guanche TaxID=7266 RepID=A0A3B0KT00_DROGU|nr:blast:Histone acetyltransferase p300 [Drosophila guanche]
MEKLGFDIGSAPADRRRANSLVHACLCRDANCRLPFYQKMKRVVLNTKNCKRKTNGGCPICKQLIALCCYHAKHCQEQKGPVSFCPNIKHKQHLQQKLQQQQLLRRRVAVSGPTVVAGGVPVVGMFNVMPVG